MKDVHAWAKWHPAEITAKPEIHPYDGGVCGTLATEPGFTSDADGKVVTCQDCLDRISKAKPADMSWTLEEAQQLIGRLSPKLKEVGWGIGLGGSVIANGRSEKDLDLILMPMHSAVSIPDTMRKVLESEGMSLRRSAAAVQAFWRDVLKQNPSDAKHVEIWRSKDGRRIDVFILR